MKKRILVCCNDIAIESALLRKLRYNNKWEVDVYSIHEHCKWAYWLRYEKFKLITLVGSPKRQKWDFIIADSPDFIKKLEREGEKLIFLNFCNQKNFIKIENITQIYIENIFGIYFSNKNRMAEICLKVLGKQKEYTLKKCSSNFVYIDDAIDSILNQLEELSDPYYVVKEWRYSEKEIIEFFLLISKIQNAKFYILEENDVHIGKKKNISL